MAILIFLWNCFHIFSQNCLRYSLRFWFPYTIWTQSLSFWRTAYLTTRITFCQLSSDLILDRIQIHTFLREEYRRRSYQSQLPLLLVLQFIRTWHQNMIWSFASHCLHWGIGIFYLPHCFVLKKFLQIWWHIIQDVFVHLAFFYDWLNIIALNTSTPYGHFINEGIITRKTNKRCNSYTWVKTTIITV